MRWRSREEPCGSHHAEARALKCETSSGETEECRRVCDVCDVCGRKHLAVRGAVRRRRLRLWLAVLWRRVAGGPIVQ